jgi:hypothetical protein
MIGPDHGALMFRCPKTGEAFDSGFRFSPDEMRLIPPGYSMKLRCRVCGEKHEFKLSEAWVAKANGHRN